MAMNTCENCNEDHNGEYGSGRFCSSKCARGFSTKNKRKEINEKVSKKLSYDVKLKICKGCNRTFTPKQRRNKFCSQSCSTSFFNIKRWKNGDLRTKNWSKLQYNLYKSGKQKVGGGKTKWHKYKDFKVQGTYELRTCKILDNWKETEKIKDWEYTNDRILYLDENNIKRSYLLDFKVFTFNNEYYYIETKGWIQTRDMFKWSAVREQGYKLEVWMEKDITKFEQI
jgi:hypothetical protein